MPVAPLMVRNTQGGPTILSIDPKGSDFVEWAGANDVNGGDVQIVPEQFHNNVAFLRCVQRGILIIENADENPSISEALDKQNAAWAQRQARSQSDAQASIDHQANNDLVVLGCVGPAQKGQGLCGADVPVRDLQKDTKPPLCNTHEDLASQYVPEESIENGKSKRIWTRMTMGSRERQQQ